MLTTIQRESNCYSRDFFKKLNAFFKRKMPQILTQIDKKTQKFRILKILCNFRLFFEKLGDLECQRRQTRKRFVVREASLKR